GQHRRFVTLGGIMGVRNRTGACIAFRLPLVCAAWALGRFPLVLEQVFEVIVTPFRRRASPGDLQAARNCVTCDTGGVGARPAEALLLNRRAFRFFTEVGAGPGSVGFSKGVTACDQSDGFFIVHRHPRESLADILRCRNRIWLAFWALR